MTLTLQIAKAAATIADPGQRKELIASLTRQHVRHAITACTSCPLALARAHSVPFSGVPGPIALVLEAPDAAEDQAGVSLVGRSGELLRTLIARAGLPENLWVQNTVCCHPPNGDFAAAISVNAPVACRPHFAAQLQASGAWLAITVGLRSLESLTGRHTTMGEVRGKPFFHDGRIIVATYHPAYALRSPNIATRIVDDLRMAKHIVDGDRLPPGEIPESLLDAFLGDRGDRTRYQFTNAGYLRVWSHLFGEEVAVVRDMDVLLPASVESLPRWTVAELVRIDGMLRDRRFGWQDLRHIQNVKREFLAEVVK